MAAQNWPRLEGGFGPMIGEAVAHESLLGKNGRADSMCAPEEVTTNEKTESKPSTHVVQHSARDRQAKLEGLMATNVQYEANSDGGVLPLRSPKNRARLEIF